MAVYASSITLYTPKIERISRSFGFLAGKLTVSNYNATTVEETGITRYFRPSATSGIQKGIVHMSFTTVANGYVWGFDKATGKVKIFQTATVTPAGTNGTSTVTGNVVVVGGGIGEAVGINPDTNAGVLSKTAATNRTIPVATFLGGTLTAGTQTFTGSATTAAALAEIADDTNAGAVDFIAFGFIA